MLWAAALVGSFAVLPYLQQIKPIQYTLSTMLIYAVQQAILFAIVIFAGIKLSKRNNLTIVPKHNWHTDIKIGILAGTAVGLFLIFLFTFSPIEMNMHLNKVPAILASIYGAINEELLCRLFLVPLCIFLLSKLYVPNTYARIISVIVVAIVFALGHMPLAYTLDVSYTYLLAILLGNSSAGIVFGLLFIRYSLLCAMIAHGTADIIVHVMPLLILKS